MRRAGSADGQTPRPPRASRPQDDLQRQASAVLRDHRPHPDDAIAVVLFWLIGDSEEGKTDAGIATGMSVAFSSYRAKRGGKNRVECAVAEVVAG